MEDTRFWGVRSDREDAFHKERDIGWRTGKKNK